MSTTKPDAKTPAAGDDKATANAKTATNEAERHKVGETPAKAAKDK